MTTFERARIEWMDFLRGVSIVLVAINHSILFARDTIGSPDAAIIFNEILAPIRMPMMVFLSGLLIAPSLAKGTGKYLAGKGRGLAYPYMVWSVIVLLQGLMTDARAGEPLEMGNIARIVYDPLSHLWFLYYLLIYYVIALVVRRLSTSWVIVPALVGCAAIPDENFRRFFVLLAFFMIGKAISDRPELLTRALACRWVLMTSGAVFLAGIGAVLSGEKLRYTIGSVPLAIAGILLAIALAQRIVSHAWARTLRFVGRESLVFYLVHWYPTSLAVKLSSALDNQWLTLFAGAIAGVSAGFLVCWIIKVLPPVGWLFVIPRRSVIHPHRLTARLPPIRSYPHW